MFEVTLIVSRGDGKGKFLLVDIGHLGSWL